MSYFKDLPQNPNFPQLEKEILAWWYHQDLVSQYLHKNDTSKTTYSFIDGPITANGPMGVHHARGRTLKDLFQRYKNAQGYQQRFQNGFDCQGLWVEVEIEKENGFNSKKDIQNFGLDKFVQACLNRVNFFASMQTEQSKRLGMFMDWDNSYYTNSATNNLYIWHFLKTVHQKGWLIKKKSAATWCPRCETGLSQHEQADGYKDVTDTSVYLKFKLKDRNNEYVLVWTTTPWTLSTNVLLAINTQFDYIKFNQNGQTLYLAKLAADRLGITDYQSINASSLLNLEYESLYQIPAQKGVKHYITNWDLVNPSEGSGVVHVAPGCGQEDFELGQSLNSDMIAPLDETGHFLQGYGGLSGKYAHDITPLVFKYLKSIDALYKTESITHRYPHCWRCKTKCLFRLEDSWYIISSTIRPYLKKAAATVTWHPKYTGRRMQNWLDNMEDWMIGRKRFYGLALPFYPCSCGELTVVGSKEELKSLATNPKLVDDLTSFHRPYIDEIKINCPKCGKEVSRIPDVGDCWLDAGVVPFSTLKYLEDKTYWHKWFPSEVVLEMIEQVRLWFYSMLFFGVTFEGVSPYRNVVSYSEVRDESGERMSKTKKNGIPFDDAVSKMGADAMRWLYCQQTAYTTVNFGYNIADRVKRDFLLILWNSYRFYTQHANFDNWHSQPFDPSQRLPVIDQWILSRLNSVINKVTHNLDKYRTSLSTKVIEGFVSDLSTWYIRRSRDRNDNYALYYYIFTRLSLILSPFTPYLSEIIFQNLSGFEIASSDITVHSQNWPASDASLVNPQLEEDMELTRQFCQLIHAQRQLAQIKIRQPLSLATIKTNRSLPPDLVNLISQECNLKKVILEKQADSHHQVTLDMTLTPDLIAEGQYRDLIRQIQVLRHEQQLLLTDKIRIFAPSWPTTFHREILDKTLAVSIDTAPELRIEKV